MSRGHRRLLCTALLVQGSRITYPQEPFDGRAVTVLLLVQTKPKNVDSQHIIKFTPDPHVSLKAFRLL